MFFPNILYILNRVTASMKNVYRLKQDQNKQDSQSETGKIKFMLQFDIKVV
jgi:hypothetical protein